MKRVSRFLHKLETWKLDRPSYYLGAGVITLLWLVTEDRRERRS